MDINKWDTDIIFDVFYFYWEVGSNVIVDSEEDECGVGVRFGSRRASWLGIRRRLLISIENLVEIFIISLLW